MRGRGINYDTGFFPGGKDNRPGFDSETVRREMAIIAGDLHCTAVRDSGGDPERLGIAARHAAEAGLEEEGLHVEPKEVFHALAAAYAAQASAH